MDKKPKLGELAQALMNLKWSEVVNVAVLLNVPLATLQKIEEDNAAGVRLLVALDAWLKSDRKASWKKVVRVLKELGMDVLAQEVEEKCKKLAEAGSESEEEEDRACSPVATTRTPPPPQCTAGLEVPPSGGLHGGIPAGQRSPFGRVSPARQISPAGRISPAVQDVSGAEESQLLMDMHDVLLPAQTKSRFLALKLKVPPYAVDGIFSQFRDPKEQLLEVLKEFLTTTADPSEAWPVIAKALRSRAIGLPRLAKSIEENYCSPPTHLTPHSSHNTPSSSHSTPHTSPSSHLTTHTPHSSHSTPETDSPVAPSHPSRPGVCSASRHIVFETPQPSGPCHSDTPTLPKLLRFPTTCGKFINIIEMIGAHCRTFSILLLNDDNGAITDAIWFTEKGDAGAFTNKVLTKWLRESCGREPKSWVTLAIVIEETGLSDLAKSIQSNLT